MHLIFGRILGGDRLGIVRRTACGVGSPPPARTADLQDAFSTTPRPDPQDPAVISEVFDETTLVALVMQKLKEVVSGIDSNAAAIVACTLRSSV